MSLLADIPNEPGLKPIGRYGCKMATPQGAQAALLALNGKELGARLLTVPGGRVCILHDA